MYMCLTVPMCIILSYLYAEDLMWSKLDSGRLPSLNEVISMVTDQMQGDSNGHFAE